jgi:hypothetical protein
MHTSANGIVVRVIIHPNQPDARDAERFTVIPQGPGMFADPPTLDVPDGETQEIYVQGGMS